MATYTSKEMNGSGSLGGELSGTQIFTITNPLNSLNNRNTGYLTLEGNATANQNLSITTYLTGAFSAFNGVSDRGLVYNSTATHWSISVAGSGGSFAFTPTNDIAAGSYYIKSTGLFSLTVESDVEERFVMSVRIGESAPEVPFIVSPKISLDKPSDLSPDRIIGSDVAEKIEGETFTLPWIGTYDVDWGDGTKQTGVTDSQTHTYATSGDYDIKVKAATGRIYFNNSGDKSKVIDIKNWGTCIWTSMQVAFAGCDNLTTINSLDTPDLSSVTNMANMFRDARNLSTIQNINSWNINNVQNIGFIFGRTNFNQDIGNWDTSNVTDMSGVFWVNTQFNHNVGNWNTSNVTTVYKMFDNNKMNHSLAGWDISNITNFGGFMTNNTNLSPENYDATLISWASQSPQPNVNIAFRSKHTYRAASAMQTLIDTYGWTITDGGLVESPEFVISVQTDNDGSSADNQFTLPWIGTYDVDWGDGVVENGVVDTQTHTYASAGTYDVKVTAASGRISFNNGGDKTKLLDIKNWGTCEWVNLERAFMGCNSLTDVTATDTPNFSNLIDLGLLFYNATSLTSIDVSSWDVSNVEQFDNMFVNCDITSLDVSNWNVSNAINLYDFVGGCILLTTLDVSNWNVGNCENFKLMFRNCTLLNPDVSNWDISSMTQVRDMFNNADSFDRSLANWGVIPLASYQWNLFMPKADGLSTVNYDATLIAWAALTQTSNININFGGSQYSYEAAAARQTLIDTYGWTITDGGQAVSPEFALKWETTTPSEEVQLGVGNGTFDYVIDWGDGTVESYNTDANISHIYSDAGDHITRITGIFPHYSNASINWPFNDKLKEILNWGTISWESLNGAFRGARALTVSATDIPIFGSNTIDLATMFYAARGITNIPNIDQWDWSKVTAIASMFLGKGSYQEIATLVGNFNITSNLTNASRFMSGINTFPSLESWDVTGAAAGSWNGFYRFFDTNTSMSTEDYDATLISWAAQSVNNNVQCSFGISQYTLGGAAEAARNTLINTYGWTITDGGPFVSPFVIQVKTDNTGVSADNEFTLPWIGTYDVDWGDGNTDTGVVDTQTHTYASAGTYDVAVTAVSGRIYFNNGGDKDKLLDIKNWGSCAWTSMERAFEGCSMMDITATDIPNLTNISSTFSMFSRCTSLIGNDSMELWDVSSVTNMSHMFWRCGLFNINISVWDMSNVTNITRMLYMNGVVSSFNQPIGDWDVSSLVNARAAFEVLRSFNHSLGDWDISNVTDFRSLFEWTPTNTGMDISNYNDTLIKWAAQTPQNNVQVHFGNFKYSYEAAAARQTLIDTYGWTITDGGQVASPEFAISVKTDNVGTSADNQFTLPWIGTYDVDWGDGVVETGVVDTQTHTYDSAGTYDIKVTAATGSIFFNAPRFTDYKLLQIKNWGDCEWTSLESAFAGCANLDFDSSNIDAPNLQNCTSLYKTFNFCTSLGNLNGNNVDLSSWDVSNVTNIGQFFITYNQNVNVNLSGWVINPNITFLRLIDRCNILDVTDWDVSGVTNFSNIFNEARRLREIVGLNTWDVSNGVDFTSIFRRTEYLTSLGDLSSWSFAPNSNLSNMFFASIKENRDQNTKNSILNLDVSNATNMRNMFNYSNITSWLNLSNWDVSGVSDFNGFLNNSTLTTENYDETLISWATQSLQNNINIGFGNSQYTLGGAAEAARNTLINTYGWTITDGGGIFVGLLDTYPNASAAYSLRDLASASVGNAVVRVRRSLDNAEQDFSAVEITDGTLTTFTGANDGFVTVWYDQSGNSNNAVQATATAQPKLVSSGVIELVNGKPCLKLDQYSPKKHFILNNVITGTQSTFLVNKKIGGGGNRYIYDGNADINRNYAITSGNRFQIQNKRNTYVDGSLVASADLTVQNLLMINLNANSQDIGILFARYTTQENYPGMVQEMIFYPSDQITNRTGIETNINNEYTIY